ncbi:unnamed protein product, partial [Ilex paraguariensis]
MTGDDATFAIDGGVSYKDVKGHATKIGASFGDGVGVSGSVGSYSGVGDRGGGRICDG